MNSSIKKVGVTNSYKFFYNLFVANIRNFNECKELLVNYLYQFVISIGTLNYLISNEIPFCSITLLLFWSITLPLMKFTRPCILKNTLRFPSDNSINLFDCWMIFFLRISFNKVGNIVVSYTINVEVYWSSEQFMLTIGNLEYIKLQKILFLKNSIIPDVI